MPTLRKRKPQEAEHGDLFSDLRERRKVLIFSGAGLSSSSGENLARNDCFLSSGNQSIASGMSTFGKSGGIYERAKKRFNLSDGKSFFQYSFFDQNRLDVLPFYAELHQQAVRACPAAGHLAITQIALGGRLLRHYTMNIDGLAARAGMEIWNGEAEKRGSTVELHGNIFNLVCHSCGHVEPLDQANLKSMRARRPLPCPACSETSSRKAHMRPKVLLYDDAEGEHITPNKVMDLMEADAKVRLSPFPPFNIPRECAHRPCACCRAQEADLVLWVGVSFEQSASAAYFAKVSRRRRRPAHWRHTGSSARTARARRGCRSRAARIRGSAPHGGQAGRRSPCRGAARCASPKV